MRCRNCGAPLRGDLRAHACSYCGATPPLTATVLERELAKGKPVSTARWPPLGEPGKVRF